jgi:hypothetical protein
MIPTSLKILLLLVFGAASLHAAPKRVKPATPPPSEPIELRWRAAAFVNQELRGKRYHFRGEERPYPQITAKHWTRVQWLGGRWVLSNDRIAGLVATVSFSGDGKDPKLESYGVSIK